MLKISDGQTSFQKKVRDFQVTFLENWTLGIILHLKKDLQTEKNKRVNIS